jgi:hypothetical protein
MAHLSLVRQSLSAALRLLVLAVSLVQLLSMSWEAFDLAAKLFDSL